MEKGEKERESEREKVWVHGSKGVGKRERERESSIRATVQLVEVVVHAAHALLVDRLGSETLLDVLKDTGEFPDHFQTSNQKQPSFNPDQVSLNLGLSGRPTRDDYGGIRTLDSD